MIYVFSLALAYVGLIIFAPSQLLLCTMEFQHEDRYSNIAPPVAQTEFRLNFASTDSVKQAIVQLSFKKGM